MKTKRFVSWLLVITLVVSLLPGSIFSVSAVEASSDAVISVRDAYTKPGAIVNVDVMIENNPGILGMTLKLQFDDDIATLTEVVGGDALSNMTFTPPKGEGLKNGCTLLWDAESVDAENVKDGIIATLTFQIAEDAQPDEIMDVSVSAVGEILDADAQPLNVTMVTGQVQILTYTPGDVNDDGQVTSTDVVYLRRYIAGGYGITINEAAGDVNNDGVLTSTDVVYIRRYIVGGYGIILRPSIPKCDHTMQATNAKDATCTEEGNTAYWYCESCQKYFKDADGESEITLADTVITATGHTEVIDEAVAPSYTETGLTEGSHCSVCGEVIVAQETVPVLEATYHAITYKNLNGAESPAVTQYAEHEGLLDLPEPSAVGYKFVGWYTQSVGGDIVDYIPVGSTQDYVLFAHWEAIEYTVTYKDAPSHTNATQYTIEDEVILSDPEWPGLIFAGWIDADGNPVTKIEKGSTGAVQVTATWREKENYAVPTKGIRELWMHYDEEYSQQYFVYDLGTIYNVVLETFRTKDKMVGESIDWSYTNEVSFEQSNSETASKAITHSVSKTTEWSETNEWAKSHSDTFERGFTVGGEWAPIKDVLSFNLSGEFNWSDTDEETWGTASTNGESNSESEEFSDSYSSAVTFNKTVTESITTTTHISEQMPAGTYKNVAYGSVRVFAVVTYDVTSGNYRVDTFSVLSDEVGEMTLYEPPVESNINIQSNAGLPLDIPLDELEAYMDKAYYVQYESNGGSGDMMISAHISGEAHELSDNLFTKEGYTWVGWKLADGTIVPSGSQVSSLAASGELLM